MNSLRNRILAILLGVGLLPVLISLAANFTLTKQDAVEAKHQELRSLSMELTRSLSRIMQSASAGGVTVLL